MKATTRNNILAGITGFLATITTVVVMTFGPSTNADAATSTGAWQCTIAMAGPYTGAFTDFNGTYTIGCNWTGSTTQSDLGIQAELPVDGGWIELQMNGPFPNTFNLTCTGGGCNGTSLQDPASGDYIGTWFNQFPTNTSTQAPMDCSSYSFLDAPLVAGYPTTQYYTSTGCNTYDDSSSAFSVTYNGGTTTAPCTLTEAYDQYNNAQPSTAYQYKLAFSGGADKIAIDPGFGSTTTNTQTVDGQTFSSAVQIYTAPTSPLTASVLTPSTFTPNALLSVQYWCEYNGTWTQWFGGNTGSSGNPPPGTNTGGTFDLTACFQSSGMSLYDPVSWVTGGLKDGICIGQWLFIPNTNNNTSTLLASIEAKPPLSDITDAVSAATTMINAINTSATANTCSPPTLDPFSQSTGYLATLAGKMVIQVPVPADVCAGTLPSYDATVGEVFGYRTFFRAIEALGIWLATLAILWRMMPWARRGDGVDVVTAIGHAGGMTLYSDGTATED